MGLDKIGWLTDSTILTRRLQQWHGMVRPLARWYLDTIALPGAPIFRARGAACRAVRRGGVDPGNTSAPGCGAGAGDGHQLPHRQ